MLLCLFMFASCSSDNDDTTQDETKTVKVQLTITVGSPKDVTRAGTRAALPTRANTDWTDPDPTEEGTTDENYIDPSELHIIVYDNNGNYVAQVENMVVAPTSTTGQYLVTGDINIAQSRITNNSFSGRVSVYANVLATIDWTSPASTVQQNLNYSYEAAKSTGIIPMWGTKTTTLDLRGGSTNDIDDIYLLRALAKITVKLRDDMIPRGVTLDGTTLNRYNTAGYCLPGKIDVADTRNLTYAQAFHVYNNTTQDGTLIVPNNTMDFGLTDNATSTTDLYVPEYENSNPDNTASITVRVKFSDGDTRSVTFDFGNYTDGDWSSYLNIYRNHHYVFNIYGDQLKIEVKEEPWTVIEHPDINL